MSHQLRECKDVLGLFGDTTEFNCIQRYDRLLTESARKVFGLDSLKGQDASSLSLFMLH